MNDKFNLGNLLKGAKKVQEMVEQAKEDLAKIEVVGESGAGAVQVTITGRNRVKDIDFDDSLLQEPIDVLKDLIKAAINDALKKLEATTQSKMTDASKFFNMMMPGDKEG